MLAKLKNKLYFPIASYFRFFAGLRLRKWNPRIIVVTGSSGKTTLLHLIEAQIGEKAKYSYHANSSFGIPFDILNLHRSSFTFIEFLKLLVKAPLNAFMNNPSEKYYVVEADSDRPGEGKFLAQLLKPEITLWLNSAKTHSMNFDDKSKVGETVDELIAFEFGYFIEYCKELVIINGDNPLQNAQLKRAGNETKIEKVKIGQLKKFEISLNGSIFKTVDIIYTINQLLPEVTFYSLRMTEILLNYLNLPFDSAFRKFKLPPGRATLLTGIKGSLILDSSYNANLSSMKAILLMFAKLPFEKKWVVLGDMLELGKAEKAEHEELAEIINSLKIDKVILIGKLVTEFTYPKLKNKAIAVSFLKASDSLEFFGETVNGRVAMLFKGSQSIKLEGIIERLLANQNDIAKLPRQSDFWKMWRRKAGL